MLLGIDIDGVLGKVTAPGVVEAWYASGPLCEMINALFDCNSDDHVYFITACCGRDDDPEQFRATREKHLEAVGIYRYHWHLILTRYGEKGIACREYGIDIFIDDQDDNLADVARDSPQTVCLKFIGSAEQ